ncbi:hypothetical protein AGMMS50268_12140 [Spirochaetia bacterium]|nr:hypothetical protein AGMMS50268_12140 [Spirochaetia bacterium]
MNANFELVIILAIVALAVVFLAVKIVKTAGSKAPDCCAGKGRAFKKTTASCPHCAGAKKGQAQL